MPISNQSHTNTKWEAKNLALSDLPNTIVNTGSGTNGLNAGVSTSSLSSGNVLTYNGSNWVNSTPTIPSTLQALTGDVSITESGLTDNTHVLSWSHTDTKWEAKILSMADLPNSIITSNASPNGLGAGVSVSGLSSGNMLAYNGTNWVNQVRSKFLCIKCK